MTLGDVGHGDERIVRMSLRPDKFTHSPTPVKAMVARILRRSYTLILLYIYRSKSVNVISPPQAGSAEYSSHLQFSGGVHILIDSTQLFKSFQCLSLSSRVQGKGKKYVCNSQP